MPPPRTRADLTPRFLFQPFCDSLRIVKRFIAYLTLWLGSHLAAFAFVQPFTAARFVAPPPPVTENPIPAHESSEEFQTKLFHPRSGFCYFGARFYDPNTGRFLSRDPSGEGSGINLYQYCFGSPLNYYDPFGRQAEDVEANIAALQNRFKPIGQAARATEAAINTILDFTPVGDAVALTTGKDMSGNDVSGLAKAAVVVGMFSPLDEAGDVYKAGKKCDKIRKKIGSLGKAKGTDALRQENKQLRDIVKKLGLSKDQQRRLHDEISGQGLDYKQIEQTAQDLFGGGP